MNPKEMVPIKAIKDKTKTKPLTFLIYFICACLVSGYILILLFSIHPKISIMYYLSYIGTIDELIKPENQKTFQECINQSQVTYQLGNKELLTYSQLTEDRYNRIACGWGVPSEDGIWCDPEGGYLFYKIDNLDTEKDLVLDMDVFSFTGYSTIAVKVNGTEIKTMIPQTGHTQITIPADLLLDSYLYLCFQPKTAETYDEDASFCLTAATLHQ